MKNDPRAWVPAMQVEDTDEALSSWIQLGLPIVIYSYLGSQPMELPSFILQTNKPILKKNK